jgi:hypothetical protein
VEGNIPRIHPTPSALGLNCTTTSELDWRGGIGGSLHPRHAHAWARPPRPALRPVDRALGLDHRGVVGLTDLGSRIELLLLFNFYAFQKAPFLPCFTCFRCMFMQNVNSTGTSGNTLVANVYVYRSVCFPPFWTYVGGINVSITTTNKIPQAYPLLILEQKLRRWMLIRSCYYADYISKMPCL